MCIDSGACDTVMPRLGFDGIPIVPSLQSLAGIEYEVANSETIPNLGERRCQMAIPGSTQLRSITFQVADVHKPLLSVAKCADLGYECRLGKNGGVLIELDTGEQIPLVREGNLYSMKVWIKAKPTEPSNGQGFSRPR